MQKFYRHRLFYFRAQFIWAQFDTQQVNALDLGNYRYLCLNIIKKKQLLVDKNQPHEV